MNELDHYRCMISPGYIAVSDEPSLLCSVSGNGVIVTLWDRIKKRGGIAHCIYPKKGWGEKPTNYHADTAVQLLITQMLSNNSYAINIEAHLFGGGSLRGISQKRADKVVRVAKDILRKNRISVISEDTGGEIGRKIMFDTVSGNIMILKTRQIRKTDWAPECMAGIGE